MDGDGWSETEEEQAGAESTSQSGETGRCRKVVNIVLIISTKAYSSSDLPSIFEDGKEPCFYSINTEHWTGCASLTEQPAGMEQEDCFDFLFKIILIGDTDVGKTSVIQRFKTGNFSERQQSTIGVDFIVRTLNIQGRRIKMQVWDTAGQERFRTITQSYYRSAHAAMITYDITRKSTFDSVPQWIKEMEQYGAANVLMAIIGNKCDLESEREVEFNEACTLAKQKGIVVALETSAKEAQNVDQAFIVMARELLASNGLAVKEDGYYMDSPHILLQSNTKTINSPTNTEEKKTCGC